MFCIFNTLLTAVVEHVFSGSRFKCLLPRHNVVIALVLAGVRTLPTSASVAAKKKAKQRRGNGDGLTRRRAEDAENGTEEEQEQEAEEKEEADGDEKKDKEDQKSKEQQERESAWGDVALSYARAHLLQQDVVLEIEATDKGDNFIGTLFINKVVLLLEVLVLLVTCATELRRSIVERGPG